MLEPLNGLLIEFFRNGESDSFTVEELSMAYAWSDAAEIDQSIELIAEISRTLFVEADSKIVRWIDSVFLVAFDCSRGRRGLPRL